MRDQFGFSGRDNLAFAALNGLIYTFSAWQGGRFGQRRGYFNALKVGLGVMILALAAGWQFNSAAGLVLATGLLNVGMCFIWPTIEALVSEGEDAVGLPRMVGTYNVVWAATNALALVRRRHAGGKIRIQNHFLPAHRRFHRLAGPGFLAAKTRARRPRRRPRARARARARPAPPVARQNQGVSAHGVAGESVCLHRHQHLHPHAAHVGRAFSSHADVRGICVFVVGLCAARHVYRAVALDGLALPFPLARDGVCDCSSFRLRRFSLFPSLAVLLLAQIFFGAAIGLIYYSSLFYSMDAGKAKGEHGGIHEAAIGVGNFIGPGVGAASLQFLPQYASSGAVAVSVLLLFGLGGLVTIWKTAR